MEIKVELSDIKPSGEDSMLYPYQAKHNEEVSPLLYDDAYEVKMIVTMKGGDEKAWGGEIPYYDEGSFVVSLDTKTPTIRDIRNNLETMTDNCKKIP